MPSNSLLRGVSLLVLAFGLVACGGAPAPGAPDEPTARASTGGPLVGGQEATAICVPIEADGTLTIGFDILRNGGEQELTVTDVELTKSEGVQLLEASVVQLSGTTSLGLRDHYPPSEAELSTEGLVEDWAARQPVGRAVLPPSEDEQPDAFNLVLAVQADDARSSSSGVDVRYVSGGESHFLHLPTSLELRSAPDTCQSSEEGAASPPP